MNYGVTPKREQRIKNERAFTLVETVVALGLFIIAITLVVVTFINTLVSIRNAIALMSVNNNMAIAFEQMMREIRTGREFCSRGVCTRESLEFTNANNEVVRYEKVGEALHRSLAGNARPLTSNDIAVRSLSFFPQNVGVRDGAQVRILLSITVGSTKPNLQSIENTLQTTIAPRVLEE